MEKELNLLDFLILLLKNKKTLILNFLVISIIAVLYSLTLTKIYRSTVVFFPSGPSSANIFSMIGNTVSGDLIGGSKLSKRQYIALLKSRELREKLIKKFDLIHVYKTYKVKCPVDLALKVLEKTIKIAEEEEGGLGITDVISISVSVTDTSPQRASDMANYLYSLLEEKALQLNSFENRSVADFLSVQMAGCDALLLRARNDLKAFQLANKVYDVPSQIGMTMAAVGNYEAEIMVLQKEKAYMQNVNVSAFSEIQKIDNRIRTLQQKVLEVENKSSTDILPGLKLSLELSNQYLDLLKEVETYVQVRLLLRQQYELSLIKTKKNYADLYLVDAARPAEHKYKPKRAFVVLGIVGFYMFCLIAWLFTRACYEQKKRSAPQELEKIDTILSLMRFSKK